MHVRVYTRSLVACVLHRVTAIMTAGVHEVILHIDTCHSSGNRISGGSRCVSLLSCLLFADALPRLAWQYRQSVGIHVSSKYIPGTRMMHKLGILFIILIFIAYKREFEYSRIRVCRTFMLGYRCNSSFVWAMYDTRVCCLHMKLYFLPSFISTPTQCPS